MAEQAPKTDNHYDVIVVGAGFAGMYMLHKLRGLGMSVKVLEAGTGAGGTWYWNRYPGARVDIESMEYGYSFDKELEREWRWSERFATQPELLRYVNHVAEKFDLLRDMQFETRVETAVYDEDGQGWTVQTDTDEEFSARFCIMATGCLSTPKNIDILGIEDFKGPVYKTFDWPREGVDFHGQKVGIIGTGSSAIQTIPEIAKQAAHLTVFQRTPNYSIPARNAPISAEMQADWDANRDTYRAQARSEGFAAITESNENLALETSPEDREREYERRWKFGGLRLVAAYADLLTDEDAKKTAADFVARKIRETVTDPKTAGILTPTPDMYPIGAKRICIDTGYYETFNRDNVSIVSLRDAPIDKVTENGLNTTNEEYGFDALVLATGFDAMTGTLNRMNICGVNGAKLKDKWADGARAYLGLMVAGFPNLFVVTGPGSPSVFTNMIMAIEQHVEWIADCISHVNERQISTIEAAEAAEEEWVSHVAEVASATVLQRADSWYMGANVPGKTRVFMPYIGGFPAYAEKCNEVAANGYEGFELRGAAEARA